MEQSNKNTSIIVIVAIIVVAAIFFGYRWLSQNGSENGLDQDSALRATADELNPFNTEEPANPFEESSNPLENIKTNPFE